MISASGGNRAKRACRREKHALIRRFLALVAAALLLSACDTRETRALESEIKRLRLERDALARIAENLDEHHEKTKELDDDLARTVEMGLTLEHEKRVDRAAAIPGVTKTSLGTGSGWELSGTTAETLGLVRQQAGVLMTESLSFDGTTWKIKVPSYDPSPYVLEEGDEIPPPTPSPGRFATRRTTALRADIEALRKEIEELERLVGPTKEYEKGRLNLSRRQILLDAPARLIRMSHLAERVFFDERAICRAGSLTIIRGNVHLFCAPRAKDLEVAADALHALFAPEDDGWKLGPLSIDESAPEPIQGTLTHTP